MIVIVRSYYLSQGEDELVAMMMVLHVQLQLAEPCCPEVSLQLVEVAIWWLHSGIILCGRSSHMVVT